MSDMQETINNQIDTDKEILSVLPKNNKKNLQIYKNKAAEIKLEYEMYLKDIITEMRRRAIKISSVNTNPRIEEISKEIESMDKVRLMKDCATPFEKMGLDEYLFVLKRFYKNDLELVNNSIQKCLEKFRMAGINLSSRDFNYSPYAKEYMKTFLKEMKNGEFNSQKVKETFEQIYWKCPDLILHIELNFRSLYFKHEKVITTYFENEQKDLVRELSLSKEEATDKYNTLKKKLIELTNRDSALILNKFLTGEENPKNYEDEVMEKHYKKLIGYSPAELEKDRLNEYNENIERLSYSLDRKSVV